MSKHKSDRSGETRNDGSQRPALEHYSGPILSVLRRHFTSMAGLIALVAAGFTGFKLFMLALDMGVAAFLRPVFEAYDAAIGIPFNALVNFLFSTLGFRVPKALSDFLVFWLFLSFTAWRGLLLPSVFTLPYVVTYHMISAISSRLRAVRKGTFAFKIVQISLYTIMALVGVLLCLLIVLFGPLLSAYFLVFCHLRVVVLSTFGVFGGGGLIPLGIIADYKAEAPSLSRFQRNVALRLARGVEGEDIFDPAEVARERISTIYAADYRRVFAVNTIAASFGVTAWTIVNVILDAYG